MVAQRPLLISLAVLPILLLLTASALAGPIGGDASTDGSNTAEAYTACLAHDVVAQASGTSSSDAGTSASADVAFHGLFGSYSGSDSETHPSSSSAFVRAPDNLDVAVRGASASASSTAGTKSAASDCDWPRIIHDMPLSADPTPLEETLYSVGCSWTAGGQGYRYAGEILYDPVLESVALDTADGALLLSEHSLLQAGLPLVPLPVGLESTGYRLEAVGDEASQSCTGQYF